MMKVEEVTLTRHSNGQISPKKKDLILIIGMECGGSPCI
jgi:hypothetical protein